jgi:DNA-binding beta-propeller fold protein YncE
VVSEISQPEGGAWLLPSGLALIGESTFVLDTGNDRILKLDPQGRVLATLDSTTDARLDSQQPMAMATDGSRMFVANSLASEVVVIDGSGVFERTIKLEAQAGDEAPRPIGIAARADGTIVVSDAENHRVLLLDSAGNVAKSVGTGLRSGGVGGFNVPAALTTDAAGNVYVVDTLNGRIVKLSPSGSTIRVVEFADTGGRWRGRRRGSGRGRARIRERRATGGHLGIRGRRTYLGVIGRRDPQDAGAGSLFEACQMLWLSGTVCQ